MQREQTSHGKNGGENATYEYKLGALILTRMGEVCIPGASLAISREHPFKRLADPSVAQAGVDVLRAQVASLLVLVCRADRAASA